MPRSSSEAPRRPELDLTANWRDPSLGRFGSTLMLQQSVSAQNTGVASL